MTKVNIPTRGGYQQAGKSLRDKCPRVSHGKVILGQGHKRDIVALIKASNKDRLENLIPIRHGRMAQSAFAYFRGTAAISSPRFGWHPDKRDNRSGVRRLPLVELWRVRYARAQPSLRRQ